MYIDKVSKLLRAHIFTFIILVIAGSVYGSSADLEDFRSFAVRQMKQDQVPGMVIGFVQWGNGEDRYWVEAFGYSDLENQVLTKPESTFRLGSVSKPLTAAAVLLLAEQGKINLDAEVQTYVPYFPKKQWPVTVRQLLGHLGGVSHYKNYDLEGRIKEHKSTREAIAVFEKFDLVAEPGTKYSYSSYGYNLLAAVVEGASGTTFAKFMKQNVWDPLGMNDTRLDDPTDLISNRARGYRILNGQIKNSEFVDISSRLGAGGTRASVPDLLKFARGLVERKILSSASMDLVYSSMQTRDGRFTDYSTGWGTRTANGHFMLRHTGSQQETSTVLLCFPALKLAIACAINQEDAGAAIFSQRLFEFLTNERWGLTAYVTNQKDTYSAIDSVFASGMSYFEMHKRPVTMDPKELQRAFDYFRRSITGSKEAKKLIEDGPDPVSQKAYTKMGSYIAQSISDQNGNKQISSPISFFDEYLKACNKTRKKVTTCDFPNSFRTQIGKWSGSWMRTNSKEMSLLHMDTYTNLKEVSARVQKVFHSESAYPDFSREIGDLTWNFLLKGENEKSIQAGELADSLYPDSARLVALYGISLVAVSDRERGIAHLKKAYALDPASPAEPEWISDFAEEMANAGKINEAMKIMQAAVELHPNHPKLLSDMGEAYLAMNDVSNAKKFFEKALVLDPKLERAKAMLEKMNR